MTPFAYERAENVAAAVAAAARPGAMFYAGGTTIVDLMRGGVLSPAVLVDLNGLEDLALVAKTDAGLRIGALARMAEVAEHAGLLRDYPLLAESLQQAASQQLRNMASVGGNLLQRTRCGYFRDGRSPCNKREPGTGCAALNGVNREHAVLGTSSACIATYAGDWGAALAALDVTLDLAGPDGTRSIDFADLHRLPGDTPERETELAPGEMIVAITVHGPPAPRSTYLKIRDRKSYAFAIASAAVALDLDGDRVVGARVGLGGVATRPWRSHAAEAALTDRVLTERVALEAGRAAFADAEAGGENRFKLDLGPRTVARAVINAASRGAAA